MEGTQSPIKSLGGDVQQILGPLDRLGIYDRGIVTDDKCSDETTDAASTVASGKSRRSGAARRSAARARRAQAIAPVADGSSEQPHMEVGGEGNSNGVGDQEPSGGPDAGCVPSPVANATGCGRDDCRQVTGADTGGTPKRKSRPAKQRAGYVSPEELVNNWLETTVEGHNTHSYRRYGSDPSELAAAYRAHRELLPVGHPNALPKREVCVAPAVSAEEERDLAEMREARAVLPVEADVHVILTSDLAQPDQRRRVFGFSETPLQQDFQGGRQGGCTWQIGQTPDPASHWIQVVIAPEGLWSDLPAKIAWRCGSADCDGIQTCLKAGPLPVAVLAAVTTCERVDVGNATQCRKRGYQQAFREDVQEVKDEGVELRMWPGSVTRENLAEVLEKECELPLESGGPACATPTSNIARNWQLTIRRCCQLRKKRRMERLRTLSSTQDGTDQAHQLE